MEKNEIMAFILPPSSSKLHPSRATECRVFTPGMREREREKEMLQVIDWFLTFAGITHDIMSPADSRSQSQTVLCLSKLSLQRVLSFVCAPSLIFLILPFSGVTPERWKAVWAPGMRAAPFKCQVQCGETRIYTNLVQKQTRTEWNESLKPV